MLEEILLKGKGGKEAWKLSTRFNLALEHIDDYLASASLDNVNNLISQLEKRQRSKKYWAKRTINVEALNKVLGRLESYVSPKANSYSPEIITETKEPEKQPIKDWITRAGEIFNYTAKEFEGYSYLGKNSPTTKNNLMNLARIVQNIMEMKGTSYTAERARAENLALKLDSRIYQYAKEVGISYRPITIAYQMQGSLPLKGVVEERFEVKKGVFGRVKEGLSYIFKNKRPPQWEYNYAPV